MILRLGSVVVLTLWLIACSHQPVSKPAQYSKGEPSQKEITSAPKRPFKPQPVTPLEPLLKQQYEDWRGVPYRLGGLSRAGVDCSGFVYLTFKERLGVVLPRSTEAQARIGEPIAISELRTGDLVFFKTSWKTGHVGIYLNDGFFMHASTTKGVMISSLENPYWKKNYWMSRRVNNRSRPSR
jgi:cell wall-associated NlpC family hydrolase